MASFIELPDNYGTSVTNFVENLATEICRVYSIPPKELIWIEHYPDGIVDILKNLSGIFSLIETLYISSQLSVRSGGWLFSFDSEVIRP
ncbi:hypothetical protein IAQ67_12465 [Paenibacillus peoriae]|uniref:Uncharacterized protein n=1 Tax=Paenibacillus peoriae TaxID=59893 RepID=A0A7H0YF86_9BACL|nr:hypothetical protein IAQ67_12465 [Paenibacillus peoriae]